MSTPLSPNSSASSQLFFLFALLLLAFNLRGGLVVIGPLADTLSDALHLSGRSLGLLTTIPVLCFGVFSLFAARLAQRFGMEKILFSMLLILACGQALRSVSHYPIMVLGTTLLGAAIAIMNVLTPSLVRRSFPQQIPLMTALYTLVMSSGAALSAYTAIPLRNMTGDWRYAMAVWAVVAVISLVLWLPMLRQTQHHASSDNSTLAYSKKQLWRCADAWWLSLFFGFQSMVFYTCTAWLSKIFIDAGSSEYEAGTLLTLFNLLGMVASFLAPLIYASFRNKKLAMLLLHLPMLIGLSGFIFATTSYPYFWAVMMGLGQGTTISLGLTLIASHADNATTAAKLSGMCQSIGYFLAALGPLLFGILHDCLHSWHVPLLLFAVIFSLQFICALKASVMKTISA